MGMHSCNLELIQHSLLNAGSVGRRHKKLEFTTEVYLATLVGHSLEGQQTNQRKIFAEEIIGVR